MPLVLMNLALSGFEPRALVGESKELIQITLIRTLGVPRTPHRNLWRPIWNLKPGLEE